MAAGPPILVIGGTGIVGRPLVRALHAAGRPVRVMSRDVRRAGAGVPEGVEVVPGDLADGRAVRRALAGCRAVVTAVAQPLTRHRPEFDPDEDGTGVLLEALRDHPAAPLLVRTSAMAVDEAAGAWWPAADKARADAAVLEAGVPAVVLRPTWFIESLATTCLGPLLVRLPAPDRPISWLAGRDYGQLVLGILDRPAAVTGQVLDVHGAESLTMRAAVAAFARPWRGILLPVPLPGPALAAAAPLLGPASYLRGLLRYTFDHVAARPRASAAAADAIHRPTITVEACARDLRERGDLPAKRLG